MKTRLFIVLTAAGLMLSGCGKSDTKKTEPGSKQAQTANKPGQPVTPADPAKAPPVETLEAKKVVEAGTPDPAKPAPTIVQPAEAKPGEVEPAEAKPAEVRPASTPPTADEGVKEEKRIAGAVAKVNGQDIDSAAYYAEVDKILKRTNKNKIPPERLNRIKENILKRLIEKELIKQAVAKAQVIVPAEEIDTEFAEYKKRFRTEDQFQNYLKHGKVTVDSIRNRIREKKELEKLLEKTGKLAVSDQDVQDFYGKNERFYQEREGVKASHVLVKLGENASKEDEEKARAKVAKVQEGLKKGEDFGELAKKFSEGPSAPKGGDLGFFGRGQMVKPFEDKAFTMKPNEVSEPVRTRFGFHIIKVFEKREARKKTLDEVKTTIEESLRNKKFFQERRALLTSLKKEAEITKIIEIPKSAARPATPHGINPHAAGKPGARPSPKLPHPTVNTTVKPQLRPAPPATPKPAPKAPAAPPASK